MSNTDSFIEEVTEEVRRDKLYGYLKRYGWIAGLIIVLVVGGAGLNEYRHAQALSKAQALGDAMLASLGIDDDVGRAEAIAFVKADTPQGAAVLSFLTAGVQTEAEEISAAIETLNTISNNPDVPNIYRQVATFKSLILQADMVDAEKRRNEFEALAVPGLPIRMLSEEQLALIDVETGSTGPAIERFRRIMTDAESDPGLQRRALQAIIALGGSLTVEGAEQKAEE